MGLAFRNKEVFSILYEDFSIASKYVTEDVFMFFYHHTLSYLLYEADETNPLNLTPLKMLLYSTTTQTLFKGLCSDRKATLVEEMLLIRG
jgi:hypothetical protein